MSTLVRIRNLHKTYRRGPETVDVLRGIDLDIAEGDFVALMGPSGSGKTTSLMMLAGFETPTAGEILLAGKAINNVPPHKRDIGMVFQNYALFPHMTVAENLAFPLTVRGMNKTDCSERVKRALSMVQLDKFRNRYPGQLSGGQQQRVAIARAVVFGPKLILADEPTGNLDSKNGAEVMHLLTELNHEGTTIVMVTHNEHDAKIAHRTIRLFDGQIVEAEGNQL